MLGAVSVVDGVVGVSVLIDQGRRRLRATMRRRGQNVAWGALSNKDTLPSFHRRRVLL